MTDDFASSRSREVYGRLRSAIVRGELRPNERLIEMELAERLQVSRTPVREVLQRLASDGLIVNRRRGWQVREHNPEEIRELYEVRAGLEGYAARLAAERADEQQVDTVEELSRVDAAALAAPPREALVDNNDRFHDAVIAASGNNNLAGLVRRNREFYFNYRIAAAYTVDEAVAALAGHADIAAAVRARDPARAEATARRHVFEALQTTLEKLG